MTPTPSCRYCGTFGRTLAGSGILGSFDLSISGKSSGLPEGYERGLVTAAVASATFEYVSSGGGDPQQVPESLLGILMTANKSASAGYNSSFHP